MTFLFVALNTTVDLHLSVTCQFRISAVRSGSDIKTLPDVFWIDPWTYPAPCCPIAVNVSAVLSDVVGNDISPYFTHTDATERVRYGIYEDPSVFSVSEASDSSVRYLQHSRFLVLLLSSNGHLDFENHCVLLPEKNSESIMMVMSVGWDYVCELRPPTGLLFNPQGDIW
jgi:hypothetical protein